MNIKNRHFLLAVGVLLLVFSSSSHGQLLVQFVAEDSMSHNPVQPPTFLAANLSVVGGGLSGSEGGNILIKTPTTAWVDEYHFAYAPGSNAYQGGRTDTGYTLTLEAAEGYTFSITEVTFRHRATTTGPGQVGFSIAGTDFGMDSVSTAVGTLTDSSLNLSELTSAWITLQGWDSSGTGSGEFQMNNLQISGTVSSIPEPTTTGAIGGLLAFGLVLLRRWKKR